MLEQLSRRSWFGSLLCFFYPLPRGDAFAKNYEPYRVVGCMGYANGADRLKMSLVLENQDIRFTDAELLQLAPHFQDLERGVRDVLTARRLAS